MATHGFVVYTGCMEESIFTKIINGTIPSHKIYEDDLVYAFLDIYPIQPGHVLVVPKQQVPYIWDLDDDSYAALMRAVKKIGTHVRKTLNVPYVGEQIMGVDVPHAHVHIIPFTTPNEFRHVPVMEGEPDHAALAVMAERLRLS